MEKNSVHSANTFVVQAALCPNLYVFYESLADQRPNKAHEIPSHHAAWKTYPHRRKWEEIVRHGVRPRWKSQIRRQSSPPKTHPSAVRALNIFTKNIRKGQDANQYLVLEIDLLDIFDDITCSPFGAVSKGSVAMEIDARIIHDLSSPLGSSVNDDTMRGDTIDIVYEGASVVSQRLVSLHATNQVTRIMTGDVNSAFRYIPIHTDSVGRFSGTILQGITGSEVQRLSIFMRIQHPRGVV
ncbi:hypothetical protein PHPALM_27907 [Phytophthora palmivora]|uniref:Uncharacterized protein n=1 Tax=Phytophthora palmivora TaxID=4796 RepID=A0A2P4XBH3_9STRA|nr:hypothetical protein PHPALM_27907 [Phytophthora palmivora]